MGPVTAEAVPDDVLAGRSVVVAVDGGGSKTDAVAVSLDGAVVGRRRGPGSSPHFEGLQESVRVVDALVRDVSAGADVLGVDLYLSGLDLPFELEAYLAAVQDRPWGSLTAVDNDLFAALRAGTDEPDAVAVVCGTGVNAVGVRADGARVRFPSLGALSGDWGGGSGLGPDALWHAARADDGRGPDTALVDALCASFQVAGIPALIEDLHVGRRDLAELTSFTPEIFRLAQEGDAVAGGLVDRQADEVVAYVRAISQRLDLAAASFPVVLGGSILRAGHRRLDDRIAEGIVAIAPDARIVRSAALPVAGAALLALTRAGATPAAHRAAFAALAADQRTALDSAAATR